jgi:ubiquinone/menaquinone biosynthesis C-methylase UbiE
VAFSLSEIRRILKPGGYFITSVMTSRWNEYLWGRKLFREFYVNYMNRAQAHASLFSENGWNKAFVSALVDRFKNRYLTGKRAVH